MASGQFPQHRPINRARPPPGPPLRSAVVGGGGAWRLRPASNTYTVRDAPKTKPRKFNLKAAVKTLR